MEILVYFDSITGRVSSLRTELLENTNLSSIVVKLSDVENLVNGLEIFDQYRVLLDNVTKQYTLVKINMHDITSMRDGVYKIPYLNNSTDCADIVVLQNRVDNKWVIRIHTDVYQSLLKTQATNLNRNINLYITSKNDPNVLYDTLSFNIGQFESAGEIEFDAFDTHADVSIYCKKYFTSYEHIIK